MRPAVMTDSFPAANEPCQHVVLSVEFEPRTTHRRFSLFAFPTLFIDWSRFRGIVLGAKAEDDELSAAQAEQPAFPPASAALGCDDHEKRTVIGRFCGHRFPFPV